MIEQIANSPLLMIAVVVASAVGFLLYRNIEDRALGSEEHEDLSERLFPKLKYEIIDNGVRSNKAFYYRENKGNVHSVWHTKINREDTKKMVDEEQDDDDEDEDDDWINITAVLVAPKDSGLIGLEHKMWKLNDYLLGGRSNSKLYIFPTEWILQDNMDWLKVQSERDFRKYAGINYAIGDENKASFEFLNQVDHRVRAEEMQNQFHVYAEKMSEADPNKAHEINRTKEEGKINQKGTYDNKNP